MKFESYTDCLDFLYRRDQFTIKLGLDNIHTLLGFLGNPQNQGRFIHVAGTNGKGSVCYYIYQLLQLLGKKKVGIFTSPHLVSFRERIVVSGEAVPEGFIVNWLNRAFPEIDRLGATYFECVTAMAFSYFAETSCEISILETGLGGRLDATNCVSPDLCLVTSVSYDHMDMLGTELTQIWGEKIAIMKPGIPMIIWENREELLTKVHQLSKKMSSPLLNLSEHEAEVSYAQDNGHKSIALHTASGNQYRFLTEGGAVPEQTQNLIMAVHAVEILLDHEGSKKIDFSSLADAHLYSLPGRLQLLESPDRVPVLIDGAHNADGVEVLASFLKNYFSQKKITALFTVMADKDYTPVLDTLEPLLDRRLFVPLPQYKRALDYTTLIQERKADWELFSFEHDAVKKLIAGMDQQDELLLCCGSFYLLGKFIPLFCWQYPELSFFKQFEAEFE